MTLQIQSTNDLILGKSICLYGPGGSMKTRSILTAPNPIVLSTDEGLSVIRKEKAVPFCRAMKFADCIEFYQLCLNRFCNEFQTIVIDDVTEIAELHMRETNEASIRKTGKKADGRQMFGDAAEAVLNLIRDFRVLPNVFMIMIFKETKFQDDMGRFSAWPDIPGKKILSKIPHMFSEIWHAEVINQQDEHGNIIPIPCFRTHRMEGIEAKTRSGLPALVHANLTNIFTQMNS